MATHAKKIETLRVPLETKPGALAKVYGAFKEAKVNIIASWGYQMGPDQGQAHFYAADTAKAKDVLQKMGLKPVTENACFAEGDDQVGVYADLLQKISKAGVNIEATDAIGVHGKFATVLFADQKNIPALCKALGC